jgi:hypothetical protein
VEEVENSSYSIPKEDSKYMVQFPDNSPEQIHESVEERHISDAIGGRHSRRNLDQAGIPIVQRAAALKKRNLQGTSSPLNSSSNSFEILSDREIMIRAGKMGVIIPDDDFASVNLIRQLETTRNSLMEKHSDKPLMIENVDGSKTPLSMEWVPEDVEENDFICVESRKSRKKKERKSVVINRPMTRSQKRLDISAQLPGGDVKGKGKNKIK